MGDRFDIARDASLEFLNTFKIEKVNLKQDRDLLHGITSTSLKTKLDNDLAETLTEAIVDSVRCISSSSSNDEEESSDDNKPMDLNRVEIMTMQRKMATQ